MKGVGQASAEMAQRYFALFVNRLAYTLQSHKPGANGKHYYYRPKQDRRLSLQTIREHLNGRLTAGLYALNPNTQRSKWVAIDADYENALEDLLKLQWELHQDGVEAALEKSRRGAHLWIFADKPLLARHCRIYIYNLARRLKVPVKGGSGLAEGIEVFPRQDQLGPDEFGNAIRGPLGIHRATERRYWFYGADYQLDAQLEYLERLRKITETRWTASFMDSKCRKNFVRSQELSCRHTIPRAHSSAFSITFGRRRSVAETTGHAVHHARNMDEIAAVTIWPFQFRIRASTSAGPDVPRK
jgi:hypothetical protein